MMRAEDVVLVLLAAGRSQRFEDGDKLAEPFLREPLGFHVVTALENVPFKKRIAVISGTGLDYAARGYRVVENPHPESGQASSLALLIAAAAEEDPLAVMVALADMPRVPAGHIHHLLDAAEGADAIVASSDGVQPRPPALFGNNHFDALMALHGDRGARELILRGKHVVASPDVLVDIDTQEDLQALRKRFGVDC